MKGVSMKSRLRKWKHRAEVSHHLLILTLNALNALLEMLKCSLLLIHMLLYMLKFLLQMLKLRGEIYLILIHAILYRIESGITDYCEFFHTSVK